MSKSALEVMEARLVELRATVETSFNKRGAIIDAAATAGRALTDAERSEYDTLGEARAAAERDLGPVEERVTQLREQDKREKAAAASRVETGLTAPTGTRAPATATDPLIYAKGNVERSYFRDLFEARQEGNADAADRLRRNDRQTADLREKRALNTSAGTVGEFAPPLWLVDEFVALARPGRKFADSIGPAALPKSVSSVNLPKVSGGTSTAVQATQNSALSQTDMTSTSVTSGISTIGGKQVVSLQLLNQSGIPFDEVILTDLAQDYAKQFDNQSLNGSGASGQLNGVYTYFAASGTVNTTWTQATPAVGGAGGFYSKLFSACSSIESARFMAPDTVWMHPRRWNWILSSSDSNNRPLVVPAGLSDFNAMGTTNGPVPEGAVGMIGGLAVVTDANFVTNLGAGTNQDPILVGVRSDLRLWESDLDVQTFTSTYADSAGVLFRVLAYSAAIPGRYMTSVSVINGTGSVAPTF
jgi:HK97 family phage major capsid protein